MNFFMHFDNLKIYRLASILHFHRNMFRDHQEARARTLVLDFPSALPVEIVSESSTNEPPNTTAPALKICVAESLEEIDRYPLICLKIKKKLDRYRNFYRWILRMFRICSYISTFSIVSFDNL